MAAYEAVHRTIMVFGIEQSNHPMRTNHDRVVIHQDAARAPATQVRLRVAVHAGEVMFDGHGVVVPRSTTPSAWPRRRRSSALATSTGVCAIIASTWFFEEVVYHHPDAHPELFRRIDTEVKESHISAYVRVPGEILLADQLAEADPRQFRLATELGLNDSLR